MLRGGYENQIVLLTAKEAITFSELVNVINQITGRHVKLEIVPPDEYVRLKSANDPGEKSAAFFQTLLSWYEGITRGEAAMTDPLMAEVLGREPKTATEAVRDLLTKDPDYTWHQNYADREKYWARLKNRGHE